MIDAFYDLAPVDARSRATDLIAEHLELPELAADKVLRAIELLAQRAENATDAEVGALGKAADSVHERPIVFARVVAPACAKGQDIHDDAPVLRMVSEYAAIGPDLAGATLRAKTESDRYLRAPAAAREELRAAIRAVAATASDRARADAAWVSDFYARHGIDLREGS